MTSCHVTFFCDWKKRGKRILWCKIAYCRQCQSQPNNRDGETISIKEPVILLFHSSSSALGSGSNLAMFQIALYAQNMHLEFLRRELS